MIRKVIFSCFLFSIFCLVACSSGTDEKKNNETKDSLSKSVDTSLHGLVGVIEKNPPVQEGEYVKKYPSGIIQMKGYYIDGKRNGQWTSFFENGNIQSEGFFKNGFRDGKANVYYENGKLYYEGAYKDGREVGTWIFYDTAGVKIDEKAYDRSNP